MKDLKNSNIGLGMEEDEIKEKNIRQYIGCYTKKGPIPRVRCVYNKWGKKKIPDGKGYKVVSNNGKGYDYDILIEYNKKYSFDLNDPAIKFMVDSLIRGGKIKEIKKEVMK